MTTINFTELPLDTKYAVITVLRINDIIFDIHDSVLEFNANEDLSHRIQLIVGNC